MPRRKPIRDRDKELFWRKTIARQLESGLSQNEFCRRESLSANNFSSWKREIAQRDAEKTPKRQEPESQSVFVPVTQLPGANKNGDGDKPIAEIDISAGVVRIFAGIDRHALHEIIAALREVTY